MTPTYTPSGAGRATLKRPISPLRLWLVGVITSTSERLMSRRFWTNDTYWPTPTSGMLTVSAAANANTATSAVFHCLRHSMYGMSAAGLSLRQAATPRANPARTVRPRCTAAKAAARKSSTKRFTWPA